jgi:hypothetical protein
MERQSHADQELAIVGKERARQDTEVKKLQASGEGTS